MDEVKVIPYYNNIEHINKSKNEDFINMISLLKLSLVETHQNTQNRKQNYVKRQVPLVILYIRLIIKVLRSQEQ